MRLRGLLLLAIPLTIYACATSDEATGLPDAGPILDFEVGPSDEKPDVQPDVKKTDAKPDVKKDAAKADTGKEGDPCAPGASQTEACGKCGTHERVCLTMTDGGGGWGAWGNCLGEKTGPDTCDPSATPANRDCGNCGKQNLYCDPVDCSLTVDDCTEPVFAGVPACFPGSKLFKLGASCTNPNEGRFQTCDTACKWGAFGACEVLPPPPPDSSRYGGGSGFECAITLSSTVKCWGADFYGQLGDGAIDSSSTSPNYTIVQASTVSAAQSVVAGYYHACALESGGSVKCWGDNFYSQIAGATGTEVPAPAIAPGLSGVTRLAAGPEYTCALLAGGTVKCWGTAPSGSVFATGTTPVALNGASGLVAIGASSSDICGINAGGGVQCWNAANPTSPMTVSGISGATEVRVGTGFGCAKLSGGGVKCWGNNTYGQLGDGTTTSSPTAATTVSGITDASALVASTTAACVLTATHKVKCWGYLSATTSTPVEHTGYPADAIWIGLGGQLAAFSSGAGLYRAATTTSSVPAKLAGF